MRISNKDENPRDASQRRRRILCVYRCSLQLAWPPEQLQKHAAAASTSTSKQTRRFIRLISRVRECIDKYERSRSNASNILKRSCTPYGRCATARETRVTAVRGRKWLDSLFTSFFVTSAECATSRDQQFEISTAARICTRTLGQCAKQRRIPATVRIACFCSLNSMRL